MIGDWKQFEGQVFQDKFPLQKFLGSTSHSAVFLTQSPPPQPKTLAVKFITSRAKADFQASVLHSASKLRHPSLLRLLPGGRCQQGEQDDTVERNLVILAPIGNFTHSLPHRNPCPAQDQTSCRGDRNAFLALSICRYCAFSAVA